MFILRWWLHFNNVLRLFHNIFDKLFWPEQKFLSSSGVLSKLSRIKYNAPKSLIWKEGGQHFVQFSFTFTLKWKTHCVPYHYFTWIFQLKIHPHVLKENLIKQNVILQLKTTQYFFETAFAIQKICRWKYFLTINFNERPNLFYMHE